MPVVALRGIRPYTPPRGPVHVPGWPGWAYRLDTPSLWRVAAPGTAAPCHLFQALAWCPRVEELLLERWPEGTRDQRGAGLGGRLKEARARVRVGDDSLVVPLAALAEAATWDAFPAAVGHRRRVPAPAAAHRGVPLSPRIGHILGAVVLHQAVNLPGAEAHAHDLAATTPRPAEPAPHLARRLTARFAGIRRHDRPVPALGRSLH
ncbi:hypothetical protein [Bailinhaonella thermotolerans]|uniref:Uncharacterized protein n=1 Tax=Bailinhaonella thermotolerans TaxID=1070861 RepID=A0A3A4B6C9_9ACTN|nr:hypothetical protein [Bailinhaonella thermotolerans]RJL33084.1 hypothetical protein D5H75_09490 [Bailinhaonella thermotolerans]